MKRSRLLLGMVSGYLTVHLLSGTAKDVDVVLYILALTNWVCDELGIQ